MRCNHHAASAAMPSAASVSLRLFAALHFLDDPGPGDPGWASVETSGGEPTGRRVRGLYEDLGPDR
ncbi:hypothetical protein SAMN04488564_101795 [Lentzea waywayandensis]|uniref:Uncharacterized protein n=1 Tax=Lentzea waywayandensis TaxID=84724 RepID=A0A1I6D0Z2_9PSEU|nr:hypothetical protein [Lentzea waywayandensis]SFQ99168.1 hypothetical protein SAMN04488564_101795 [Lentzea waywayandensis]